MSKQALIAFCIVIAVMAGGYQFANYMGSYSVQTYKPFPFPPQEQLADRFALFPTKFGTIGIEWNTYDNKVINAPPYKLTFSIRDNISYDRPGSYKDREKFEKVEYVLIDKIQIKSDSQKTYTISDSHAFPIKLDRDKYYIELEPAFGFDFQGGEIVHTQIDIRFKLKTGEMVPESLTTEWHPIAIDDFAPVV